MDDVSFMPAPAQAGAVPFQRLRVLFALVVRDMATTFGRSVGGYFWAIAEPLGGIVLLSFAFSLALRTPPLGTSFMLFYATGYLPFSTFRSVSSGVSNAVRSNRGLLNYPVVTALDAVLAKLIMSVVTMFIIGVILFAGILITLDLHANIDLEAIILSFSLAALIGLGVGTVNCVLFGLFPTWKNIWSILTRPLFIGSGVLFLYESVPPSFEAVLWYNPLTHVIGLMRSGFFGAYDPQFVSVPYVLGVSLGLFVVGAYLLRRHSTFLIEQ